MNYVIKKLHVHLKRRGNGNDPLNMINARKIREEYSSTRRLLRSSFFYRHRLSLACQVVKRMLSTLDNLDAVFVSLDL